MSDKVKLAFEKVKLDINAINKRIDIQDKKAQVFEDNIDVLKAKRDTIKREISNLESNLGKKIKVDMAKVKISYKESLSDVKKRVNELGKQISLHNEQIDTNFKEQIEHLNAEYVRPLKDLSKFAKKLTNDMDSMQTTFEKRFMKLEGEIETGILSLAKPLTQVMKKLELSHKKTKKQSGVFSGLINALSDDNK